MYQETQQDNFKNDQIHTQTEVFVKNEVRRSGLGTLQAPVAFFG